MIKLSIYLVILLVGVSEEIYTRETCLQLSIRERERKPECAKLIGVKKAEVKPELNLYEAQQALQSPKVSSYFVKKHVVDNDHFKNLVPKSNEEADKRGGKWVDTIMRQSFLAPDADGTMVNQPHRLIMQKRNVISLVQATNSQIAESFRNAGFVANNDKGNPIFKSNKKFNFVDVSPPPENVKDWGPRDWEFQKKLDFIYVALDNKGEIFHFESHVKGPTVPTGNIANHNRPRRLVKARARLNRQLHYFHPRPRLTTRLRPNQPTTAYSAL